MSAAHALDEYPSRPNRAPYSSPANDADRREPSPAVRRKPSLTLVRCNPNHRPITTTYDVQGRTSVAGGRKPRAANHRFQRTRKVAGTATTVYHYDLDGRLIAETSNTGTPIRAYVYDDEAPIAQVTKGTTDTLVHLHPDQLGTPRIATDPARSTVWRYDGNAFGDSAPNEDPDGDNKKTTVHLRFPGQYYDAETGLHYNWYRYYDPRIGRYVTSDPIGLEGGLNTYAYVDSNPLRGIDPSGLEVSGSWVQKPNVHDLQVEYSGSSARRFPQGWKWLPPSYHFRMLHFQGKGKVSFVIECNTGGNCRQKTTHSVTLDISTPINVPIRHRLGNPAWWVTLLSVGRYADEAMSTLKSWAVLQTASYAAIDPATWCMLLGSSILSMK